MEWMLVGVGFIGQYRKGDNSTMLHYFKPRAEIWVLGYFDLYWKSCFQLFYVGDNEDLVKIAADGLDCFDQLLESLLILGAETLVDKEGP